MRIQVRATALARSEAAVPAGYWMRARDRKLVCLPKYIVSDAGADGDDEKMDEVMGQADDLGHDDGEVTSEGGKEDAVREKEEEKGDEDAVAVVKTEVKDKMRRKRETRITRRGCQREMVWSELARLGLRAGTQTGQKFWRNTASSMEQAS